MDAIVAIDRGLELEVPRSDSDPPLTWPGQHLGLSQREAEVLTFITRGLTNEEMARRAFLSTNTIKSHSQRLYRKIGVTRRSQAVAFGYANGFLSTDDTEL